jgi:hypothetical protein
MSPTNAAQSRQTADRWIQIGLRVGWLMMLGGLIGVLSSRLHNEQSTAIVYATLVASGTLLHNTLLFNLSKRRQMTYQMDIVTPATQQSNEPTELDQQ